MLFSLGQRVNAINNQWSVFQRYFSQFAHDSHVTRRMMYCLQAASLVLAHSTLHEAQARDREKYVEQLARFYLQVRPGRAPPHRTALHRTTARRAAPRRAAQHSAAPDALRPRGSGARSQTERR